MKGRNGPTSFLPSKKKGGLGSNVISEKCLTENQVQYVYDKIESGDELQVRKSILQLDKSNLPKQVKERM